MQTNTMQTCNENNRIFLNRLMDSKRDALYAKLPNDVLLTLQLADGDISFYAQVPDEYKLRYLDDQIEGLYIPDGRSGQTLPFLEYANAGDLKVLSMQQSLTPAAKCIYVNTLNQMADCIYLAYFADRAFENWLLSQDDFYELAVNQYLQEGQGYDSYEYEYC